MNAWNKILVLIMALVLILPLYSAEIQMFKPRKMTESMTWENMPNRNGEKPATTDTNPHTQLNQQPMDLVFINELSEWAFQLTKINRRPSAVSVPGAMAMWMEEEHSCTKCNAFMVGTEFAHFHPHPDYSLHLGLPKKDAEAMISKGWGEWHPLIARGFLPPNIVMLYAPRNEEEMEVAKIILNRSYEFAQGKIKE